MKQRIITALILAPLILWGVFELPMSLFIIAMTAVIVIGFWEWTQFISPQSRWINLIPAVGALALSFILFYPSVEPFFSFEGVELTSYASILLLIAFIWWLLASGLVLTYPKSAGLWQSSPILKHLFGILSLIPFLWSVFFLRAANYAIEPYHGSQLVLYVCLLVWAADTGAYFTGKALGKYKMAPNVSPNKTIEGLVGGIILAMFIGWCTAKLLHIPFVNMPMMLLITFVTVVISVLGDLVESMLKRVSNIKDSSNILPGHGGILDRIDSLLAAFPVFTYLYFLCQ